MYNLGPEAVTDLEYVQSYGHDNLMKITISWMVSLQSETIVMPQLLSLFNFFNLLFPQKGLM